jgi:predicted methyltransferase
MIPLRVVFSALVLSACARRVPLLSIDEISSLLISANRTPEDKALDASRKPEEFLAFVHLTPGMKVAELMAGGGYTAELLAIAVAPNGMVYGENPKAVLEMFAEKPWNERVTRVGGRIVRLDRELDDPFPSTLDGQLDAVVSNVIYHDTVWLKTDRQRMNLAVFQALKSGGVYVVCDSSAKKGTGVTDSATLHRIDEQVVRTEVIQTGFSFGAEGSFLRNANDTRDWNASPGAAGEKRGTSDRFCFRFVRP